MSNSNQFPPGTNLTILPAFLREAMDTVVPTRPGEVPATILLRRQVTMVYPNGRFMVHTQAPEEGELEDKETVSLKLFDHKGIELLAQVILTPAALAQLLPELLRIHRDLGGAP